MLWLSLAMLLHGGKAERQDLIGPEPPHHLYQDSMNVRRVGAWPYGPAYAVAADSARNHVFLGSGGVIIVLNVSGSGGVSKTGEIPTPGVVGDLFYDDASQRLFVADGQAGLRVIDVSDPANPVEVGSYDTPGWALGVAVSGNHAFVADRDSGLRVIDVSDPANPVEVGFYDTPGFAEGVAVSGNYAFVADDNAGLQILEFLGTDVAEDRSVVAQNRIRLIREGPRAFRLVLSGPLRRPASLALYALNGRHVRAFRLGSGVKEVPLRLQGLPAGVYVLRTPFASPFRLIVTP